LTTVFVVFHLNLLPLAMASQSLEDEAPRRITFARGRNRAVIQAQWVRGTTTTWLVRAREGQKMTVKIKSIPKLDNNGKVIPDTENDAVFDIGTPSGKTIKTNKPLWKGRLPETGDYSIYITGDHGNTHYILTVSIR
jgi:hypothetical protein